MRKSIYILIISALVLLQAHALSYGADPLTLTYAGGTGGGESDSKFVENNWTYDYQYHVFLLSGDIPQGSLFSQIQVEESDGITQLGYAHLSLNGSTYSINLGDSTVNFSDITLNNVAYEGAGVTLKPSSNFNMTVVAGSRGNGLWGANVRRDTRPEEKFTGVKTSYNPTAGLGLSATYLTTPGGSDVLAYGGEYDLDDLKFAAEYGSAIDGKAFSGQIQYQDNWLTLGTTYRDVDPTYVIPFDAASYKGMKGTYSTLGIRPSNNLSINVQSDSYVDYLNGDPNIPILDTRGDMTYNLSSGTNIGYSGWSNDRQAYDRGGISNGEMMYITQQFYLLTKNAVYFRSQPSWFQSFSPSEESYSENKDIAGLNISLFDAIHLNYEVENAQRIFKSTDIEVDPSAVTARMDLMESQIMGTPFYLSSSINYRKDIPDKDASEEADSTTAYSDVTIKYSPGPDMSCYITAKVMDMSSPDIDRTAREERDLSFGLNYTFSTNIYMK
jgi:hypothetical protein